MTDPCAVVEAVRRELANMADFENLVAYLAPSDEELAETSTADLLEKTQQHMAEQFRLFADTYLDRVREAFSDVEFRGESRKRPCVYYDSDDEEEEDERESDFLADFDSSDDEKEKEDRLAEEEGDDEQAREEAEEEDDSST
jgi:hypothetical protein